MDFRVEQLLKPGFHIVITIKFATMFQKGFYTLQHIDCKYFLWGINILDDYNDTETKQIQIHNVNTVNQIKIYLKLSQVQKV